MTDYTPTTEEVRNNWQGYLFAIKSELCQIRGEDFDRWLAEVKAEAWEECAYAIEAQEHYYDAKAHRLTVIIPTNPYRQGGNSEDTPSS